MICFLRTFLWFRKISARQQSFALLTGDFPTLAEEDRMRSTPGWYCLSVCLQIGCLIGGHVFRVLLNSGVKSIGKTQRKHISVSRSFPSQCTNLKLISLKPETIL